MEKGKRYVVFSVLKPTKNSAAFWVRAGVANVNRDGSMNVTLDALPLDGRLHVREAAVLGLTASERVAAPGTCQRE